MAPNSEISRRPDWSFALGTALLILLVALCVRMGILGIEILVHQGSSKVFWTVTSPWGVLVSVIGVEGMLFLVGLGRLRSRPKLWNVLASEVRVPGSSSLLGIGLIVGMGPMTNVLALQISRALQLDPGSVEAMSELVRAATPIEFTALVLGLSLLPAFVEELLFRGIVQGSLGGARPLVAIVVQAVAFGIFHVDPTQGMATLLLGFGFGFVRHSSRSLVAPMVAHAAYNASVLGSLRFTPTDTTATSMTAGTWWEMLMGAFIAGLCAFALYHQSRRANPDDAPGG